MEIDDVSNPSRTYTGIQPNDIRPPKQHTRNFGRRPYHLQYDQNKVVRRMTEEVTPHKPVRTKVNVRPKPQHKRKTVTTKTVRIKTIKFV